VRTCLAILPLIGTHVNKLLKSQNVHLRKGLGLPMSLATAVLHTVANVEDWETRMVCLRAKWIRLTREKTMLELERGGRGRKRPKNMDFMISRVLWDWANIPYAYRKNECMAIRPRLQQKIDEIEIIVKSIGSKGKRKYGPRERLAKAIRSWRQGQKKQATLLASTKYPAIQWGFAMLLGRIHHVGHQALRRLILYAGRRWPLRPQACFLCKRPFMGWRHFETHVEALDAPSYAELDAWFLEATRSVSSKDVPAHLLEQTVEKIRAGVYKYTSCWLKQ
jgi:hypothetical protein